MRQFPLRCARPAPGNPDRSGQDQKFQARPKRKRSATEEPAHLVFACKPASRYAGAQLLVRADRPAPARAPVAARSNEAIAVTTTAIEPATTTATTSPTAATPTANAATTTPTATTGFRRGRTRCRDDKRRANEADRIDQHQGRSSKGTLQEVRTRLDLSHREHLQFRKRSGALPRIKLASLRPVQARSENR